MSGLPAPPKTLEVEKSYQAISQDAFSVDIEQKAVDDAHLLNNTVKSIAWKGITVNVKHRQTKVSTAIVDNVDGFVEAGILSSKLRTKRSELLIFFLGEICALMGPSGCGKTTLLNVLAHRQAASGMTVTGETFINGNKPSIGAFRRMSSYVEQEDALIGSLTVEETMHFAARLAHKK